MSESQVPRGVAVVGLGLIGGSVLRRLTGAGVKCHGYDADARTRHLAASEGYLVHSDLDSALATADIVIIASPPSAAAALCLRALAYPHAVVTELSSAKCGIASVVYQQIGDAARARFVPSHPMAGSEQQGWSHSRHDLAEGATWVICVDPKGPCSLSSLVSISRVVDAMGARTIVLSPESHDAAAAYSSHMPHVVANALIQAPVGPESLLPFLLAGGSFRDMTRVAGSDAALWSEIVALNRGEVTRALLRMTSLLQELVDVIERDAEGEFEAFWRRGAARREHFQGISARTPNWAVARLTHPDASALVELGLSGRFMRHLRLDGNDLIYETTDTSADLMKLLN